MKPPRKPQVRAGEVEYKQTSGTAWSHSYLNQKPWHPLSYPNQRRKWIAEQTHANQDRRKLEVTKEFAQEQEFFQQTAVLSKKQKEKVEVMQAVSFMYMRPPGYNAESARAAEIADERKKLGLLQPAPQSSGQGDGAAAETSGSSKRRRVKDVFGMSVATEEEFDVLKNAPRMDTGAPGRVKPFGVEIRNVKCARCGAFGHQSGDRECPMKDSIMPCDEARLARDDPLNVIMAQTGTEPLKWELKQLPGGLSPARGGFGPDDPNQQIIPTDIFDEYGGFLGGSAVPDVLTIVSSDHRKKREKRQGMRKVKRKPEGKHADVELSKKRRRTKQESASSGSSDTERDGKKRHNAKRNGPGGRTVRTQERWRDSSRKEYDKALRGKQRWKASLSGSDSDGTSRSGQVDEDYARYASNLLKATDTRDRVQRKRKPEDWKQDHESRDYENSDSMDASGDGQMGRKPNGKKQKILDSSSVTSSSDDSGYIRSSRHKDSHRRQVSRRGRDADDPSPDGACDKRSSKHSSLECKQKAHPVEGKSVSKKIGHGPHIDHGVTVIDEYSRWDGGQRCDSARPEHRSRKLCDERRGNERAGHRHVSNRSWRRRKRDEGSE